jgi:predicted secreted protein
MPHFGRKNMDSIESNSIRCGVGSGGYRVWGYRGSDQGESGEKLGNHRARVGAQGKPAMRKVGVGMQSLSGAGKKMRG